MVHTQNNRWYWITLSLTGASAVVSFVFSALAVGDTDGSPLALYAAARSVALLVAAIVLAFARSTDGLLVLALVMTVVQALDGVIGLTLGDVAKSVGPFGFAVLTGVAGVLLARRR